MKAAHHPGANALESSAVKSSARTLDILEFIARTDAAPTFVELSAVLNIPRSSLSQLLKTLTQRHYIRQIGARGGYCLGDAAALLGGRSIGPESSAEKMGPLLVTMARSLAETCAYYERRDDYAEVVATETVSHKLLFNLSIGELAPLHTISAGKAILAASSDEFIAAYIRRTGLKACTPKTITDITLFWEEIHAARRSGFSYSREEHTIGIVGIAMPINTTVRAGALSVALPMARLTPDFEQCIKRQLKAMTKRAEAALTQVRKAGTR